MAARMEKPSRDQLSPETRAEIDRWIAKYPPEHKQSAVMAALRVAQEENDGWLSTELIEAVADYLEIAPVAAHEVATFYGMYDLKPVGRHKIYVCTNISCMLRGSDGIVAHLEKKLGIKMGATTADGKFTVKEAECLAACAGAPMFQIDKAYYENLTPGKVDEILDALE
jgi:NADH-quinone oxidoreductase subunit E